MFIGQLFLFFFGGPDRTFKLGDAIKECIDNIRTFHGKILPDQFRDSVL